MLKLRIMNTKLFLLVSMIFVMLSGTVYADVTTYTYDDSRQSVLVRSRGGNPTIIAKAGTGGSISPSGVIGAEFGSSRTFTITPKAGYQILRVTVDGASKGAVSSYTIDDVNTNHTITATFKLKAQ
jgi:hypothetical protein